MSRLLKSRTGLQKLLHYSAEVTDNIRSVCSLHFELTDDILFLHMYKLLHTVFKYCSDVAATDNARPTRENRVMCTRAWVTYIKGRYWRAMCGVGCGCTI